MLFVGIWIPGTVVVEESGTDTTRLSPCCWRSSLILTLFVEDFAWIFGVMTCDLFVVAEGDEDEAVAEGEVMCVDAVEATIEDELDEWITFGLTFWILGSWVAAAGVDCEFKSVRA